MAGDVNLSLRRDADAIFAAAVEAVDPIALVYRSLPAVLPAQARDVRIIAAGKAAVPMTMAACRFLGHNARTCIIAAPHSAVARADVRESVTIGAGHPLPDHGSIAAARAVLDLLNRPAGELLLILLSGGASAMLCAPADGISLDDYRLLTSLLTGCGATIAEINCVRRHTDVLKGGGLAQRAGGVPIVALVISDVVGSPPAVIASGPVSGDVTGFADALAVLERYSLTPAVPRSVLNHLDSGLAGRVSAPLAPDHDVFDTVSMHVIADNRTACEAAATHATGLGYTVEYREEHVTGEAAGAGKALAGWLLGIEFSPSVTTTGSCLITGGETTVALQGQSPRGGRNQELALAAAIAIDGAANRVLLSGGTDGVDGTTDAAGGIVDGGTAARIRAAGIEPVAALRDHDSHRALRAAGDLLITGPTGTNVMDVQIALRRNPGTEPA